MKIPMMAIAASTLALPAAPALAAELPAESRTSTIAASPFSATPASAPRLHRRVSKERSITYSISAANRGAVPMVTTVPMVTPANRMEP